MTYESLARRESIIFYFSLKDLRKLVLIAGAAFLLGSQVAWCSVTGSISGVVSDTSGAVIPGADVVASSAQTSIKWTLTTDAQGFYSFQALPVGTYDIDASKSGFRRFRQRGLVIDVNTALHVDITLQIGQTVQEVTVSSTAIHVDTASSHMGEVIEGAKIGTMPLNGRSYTDLLALQPGVVPVTSYVNPTGETASPSQSLNPGNLSISGQRETANGFMVNGALVEDPVQQGAAIIPNLDSIAEFKILTNSYDAEYGNYSGGQINLVTKSGTNQFHGDAFEFLRNNHLDARNFYSPGRGAFHQNQFGGTFGGPIRHDKVFFFADYQANRRVVGVDTGNIPVPSAADRTGDLSDLASQLTSTVKGSGWAGVLSQKLGYPVTANEAYFTPGCTANGAGGTPTCVFPNAMIPQQAWGPVAPNLMKYIPEPNVPGGFFSTSNFKRTLHDNEGAFRTDANTRWGMLSAYYFIDDNTLNEPYPQATVPGFNGLGTGRAQLLELGDTKSLGSSMVNEVHLNYVRNASITFVPQGGVGPKLSSFGIVEGCNTLGVCVLSPQIEGVPRIAFRSFIIGVTTHTAKFIQDTYQALDNFSRVHGTHTLKLGGEFRVDQVLESPVFGNGRFNILGAETGSDFADFLLGALSTYQQGLALPMYARSRYFGLYAQDSWRAKPNLTFNYGLRWDVSYPWWEKHNQLETIIAGKQSATFPGSPLGWVFPGDPGIPRTTSPVRWDNFAPRIGLAYAPRPEGGFLKKLVGESGRTSIRAAWGLFYTQMGQYGSTQIIGDAPFGFYWVSNSPPMLDQPFLARATQTSETQRFPVALPPLNSSPSNPDNNIDWSHYEPISSSPGWNHTNELPYGENYMFSIERQFGTNNLATLSYVGSQAHHLLVNLELDPSNPAQCLSVSQPSQVAPGSPTCAPFSEDNVFTTLSGQPLVVRPFAPGLGSDGLYTTLGNSNYNALEASLRHRSGRLEFLAAYTYGKTLDQASEINDQVNPYNYRISKGLAAFDVTHNFVVSYSYELPFDKLFHPGRVTQGWILAGITRFSTGLPVTISETDDQALIGDFATGINGQTVDEPNRAPGKILNNTNPRSGQPYFNTSLLTREPLGQLGSSSRRFFHGPGINNWDMALLKNLRLTESKSLQFRAEFFNIFNHAQFNNPDGEFTDGTFGLVISAAPPRIGQVAIKFLF